MVTIRDVAREAQVGIGTVSRVLSDHGSVAPATRARVQAAMARLNYRPSAAARALARRRSQTLEVVVPLFTRYLYVEVLRGIEAALFDADYALVIRTIERQADREQVFTALRSRARVDGIIFVSLTPPEDLLAALRDAAIPVVLVDATYPALPSVTVDHEAAAQQAVEYLLGLGHRAIGYIDHRESPDGPEAADCRRLGYRAALAAAGVAARPELERLVEFSPEGGMTAADQLLALPAPPTAIFAGSDTQAMGVLEVCRWRGLRIPGELSVLGYNDIEMSWHVGLSTVHIPMRQMGSRGVELLLGELDGPPVSPLHQTMPAKLVIRGTTGPAMLG